LLPAMPPMVAREAVETSTGNHSPCFFELAVEIVEHDAGLDHAVRFFDVELRGGGSGDWRSRRQFPR
jgi:hypothetical protein